MTVRWSQVVELQQRFTQFYSDLAMDRHPVLGLASHMVAGARTGETRRVTVPDDVLLGATAWAVLALGQEPYWVAQRILPLIEKAADTLTDPIPVLDQLTPPTEAGFLLFEEPVMIPAPLAVVGGKAASYNPGDDLPCVGLGWGPVGSDNPHHRGLVFLVPSSVGSVDHAEDQRLLPPVTFGGFVFADVERQLPVDERDPTAERVERLTAALWALMGQKVIRSSSTPLPRGERRRAERVGPISSVVIVDLRAEVHRPGEPAETDAEWTHRWVVSGHWRNQWYPSVDGHQLIWVNPYIKGPEDKPLVVKERRFRVIR